MRASSLIECLSAIHQSKYVGGDYLQRGGAFLVAQPGHLKSTMIRMAIEEYPDALNLNDINITTLTQLKHSIVDGRYSTLGFGEFEKLYQRNPATAENIEGHIKALVEEGLVNPSFIDQRASGMNARCAVLGGVTPSCFQSRFTKWENNGFARRFLWCHYTLMNPEAIVDAIGKWKLINFGKVSVKTPGNKRIPYDITREEDTMIRHSIQSQPSRETPYVIAKKMYCVLKWRHSTRKAREIYEDFAVCLQSKGAFLELPKERP